MAIRRLNKDSRSGRGDRRSIATVSTLPTVKAMVDCFDRYLNLTIADGDASNDTIKTYKSRVAQFLDWCKERELYPALVTKENIKEYRKHLVDGEKTAPTIRLSLLAIKHFYTACLAEKLVKNNPVVGVKAPREKREVSSTINYLTQEELQQIFDSVAPTYKIRGDKIAQIQVLRDRSFSPHSLRHTAGTLSLQSGSSLREVQDFLGHSDPKTTAIYTHILSSQENNPASKIKIDF